MASNFDFLKNIDEKLFDIIEDAQKLFLDEYFNQCAVQVRIFAETMAKKIAKNTTQDSTFDDILNNLKDNIKTTREKEFIDDLFFIKNEGNKGAHGENIEASKALEIIKRAFEASINYAYSIKKDENTDKLLFDETLLITTKKKTKDEPAPLVQKYMEAVKNSKEELLKQKEIEFKEGEKEELFKDKNSIKKKKQLTPKQEKIKSKIKEAKKNLKQNINKPLKKEAVKKPKEKPSKEKSSKKKPLKNKNTLKKLIKFIIFLTFVTISLFLLSKMLFIY